MPTGFLNQTLHSTLLSAKYLHSWLRKVREAWLQVQLDTGLVEMVGTLPERAWKHWESPHIIPTVFMDEETGGSSQKVLETQAIPGSWYPGNYVHVGHPRWLEDEDLHSCFFEDTFSIKRWESGGKAWDRFSNFSILFWQVSWHLQPKKPIIRK